MAKGDKCAERSECTSNVCGDRRIKYNHISTMQEKSAMTVTCATFGGDYCLECKYSHSNYVSCC